MAERAGREEPDLRRLYRKLWAYRANWQDSGYIGNALMLSLERPELEWIMRQAVKPDAQP